MIIYICPKCGADLRKEVICTFPPIHVMKCTKCDWRHEEREDVQRVTYDAPSAHTGIDKIQL